MSPAGASTAQGIDARRITPWDWADPSLTSRHASTDPATDGHANVRLRRLELSNEYLPVLDP